jgi:hypothetical protein
MRRFLAIALLVLLAVPAAGSAARRSPGDGTLSIKNGNGVFTISGKGVVLGQIDRGRVTIEDADPVGGVPKVSGAVKVRDLTDTKALYSGSDINFRILGGWFKIRVVGVGVDLSFVGRGSITLAGAGSPADGKVSLDGGDTYRPMPLTPTTFSYPGP